MGKIKPGNPPRPAILPNVKPPNEDVPLLFSFKHLDVVGSEKFSLVKCGNGYLNKFLERLKSLCCLTIKEFRTNKSKAIRAHRITWSDTSEPNGFSAILNSQLRAEEAWQFEITKDEHGRVHGLIVDNVFFVVWIDPDHQLYQ